MTVKQISEMVYSSLLSKDQQAQQVAISEFFHADCTFNDPLVGTKSSQALLSQYKLLGLLFTTVKADPVCVLLSSENGKDVVVVDGLLVLGLPLLGNVIKMRVISKVEFVDEKIAKWEDVWSVLDLVSSVPLLGSLYGTIRTFNGWLAHTFVSQVVDRKFLKVKNA